MLDAHLNSAPQILPPALIPAKPDGQFSVGIPGAGDQFGQAKLSQNGGTLVKSQLVAAHHDRRQTHLQRIDQRSRPIVGPGIEIDVGSLQ